MVDEMLIAGEALLPQYAHAIPAAKQRLAKKTVATRDWEGAARVAVRPVEAMRADSASKKEAQTKRKAAS